MAKKEVLGVVTITLYKEEKPDVVMDAPNGFRVSDLFKAYRALEKALLLHRKEMSKQKTPIEIKQEKEREEQAKKDAAVESERKKARESREGSSVNKMKILKKQLQNLQESSAKKEGAKV